MKSIFVSAGGKLGASHTSPWTTNGMEIEFTVQPPGIGNIASQRGIVFDVTRQKEKVDWEFDGSTWTTRGTASFPTEDESPNDDDSNRDEDSTPTNDLIYGFDMPGFVSDDASNDRRVLRFNFLEFVRVKLTGQPFLNVAEIIEGSRASDKVAWRARLDVVDNGFANKWERNNNQPAGQVENEITLGHKPLTQNDPR